MSTRIEPIPMNEAIRPKPARSSGSDISPAFALAISVAPSSTLAPSGRVAPMAIVATIEPT